MHDIPSILAICFHLYLIATIIFLLLDNRDTSTTFAWIFVFIVFPVIGLILYFLIGRNWRRPGMKVEMVHKLMRDKVKPILQPILAAQGVNLKALEKKSGFPYRKKLFELLFNSSDSVLTVNNKMEIFEDGASKFDRLKGDLREAKHSIHMEYFIWRKDELTRDIEEILIGKVKEGLKVRILYDAIGSLFLPRRHVKKLRELGIEIFCYYGLHSPLTFHSLNYRNHRKIIVIDGKIGYTGGMNMGQEYIDGGKRFDSWRDTHIRLEGQAVNILQAVFIASWFNTTKEDLFEDQYFCVHPASGNYLPIQITNSGPDSQWGSIQQLYFTLIASAQKTVYIQSPYFIPDNSIFNALESAALSGLDVRIIMTGIPDRKLPFWSAFTYFEKLLEAGVKIFQYQKGFFHAKTIMVDGEICSIGTANMDMRSFHLNYEINSLIYDEQSTQKLMEQFHKDLEHCKEIRLKEYLQLGVYSKLRNSLARLCAPLL